MAKTGVETVTRVRPEPPTGRFGERAPSSPDVDIKYCTLIPARTDESRDLEDLAVQRMTLVAPFEADIKVDDQIRARGWVFDVEGHPQYFRTKKGKPKAVLANLRRVTG